MSAAASGGDAQDRKGKRKMKAEDMTSSSLSTSSGDDEETKARHRSKKQASVSLTLKRRRWRYPGIKMFEAEEMEKVKKMQRFDVELAKEMHLLFSPESDPDIPDPNSITTARDPDAVIEPNSSPDVIIDPNENGGEDGK